MHNSEVGVIQLAKFALKLQSFTAVPLTWHSNLGSKLEQN